MRALFITTSGTSDVTRASIPIHLAVNGSVEAGQAVELVLAGDATELAKSSAREGTHGVGVPPLEDLFAKARQHDVPVHV